MKMKVGRDNAAYRVVGACEKVDVDLIESSEFLWHPASGTLLAVVNYETPAEDFDEETRVDSRGVAVDIATYAGDGLTGEAIAQGIEEGGLLDKRTDAADRWPWVFVENGADDHDKTLESAIAENPVGWLAVEYPSIPDIASGRQVLGVRAAIEAAERETEAARLERGRDPAPPLDGRDSPAGDAFVPTDVTLADLVEAYRRDWIRDYDAMLESGEISLDEHGAAVAGLDATLRREFGDAYGSDPVPAKPERHSVGRSLAYVDSLVAQNLDPKGRIALASAQDAVGGRHTLVYLGGEVSPFAVADSYDARTGEWSSGEYFKTLDEAKAALDEEDAAIAATVKLGREAVEKVLAKSGYATSPVNVGDVLAVAGDAEDKDNPNEMTLAQYMARAGELALDNCVVVIGADLERAEALDDRAAAQWPARAAEQDGLQAPMGEGR